MKKKNFVYAFLEIFLLWGNFQYSEFSLTRTILWHHLQIPPSFNIKLALKTIKVEGHRENLFLS